MNTGFTDYVGLREEKEEHGRGGLLSTDFWSG
jgi:hypothetical protein